MRPVIIANFSKSGASSYDQGSIECALIFLMITVKRFMLLSGNIETVTVVADLDKTSFFTVWPRYKRTMDFLLNNFGGLLHRFVLFRPSSSFVLGLKTLKCKFLKI